MILECSYNAYSVIQLRFNWLHPMNWVWNDFINRQRQLYKNYHLLVYYDVGYFIIGFVKVLSL